MDTATVQRPAACTDEHLEYLDDLRKGGTINMFGAGAYLRMEFGLDRKDAESVLTYWMDSFYARHPK